MDSELTWERYLLSLHLYLSDRLIRIFRYKIILQLSHTIFPLLLLRMLLTILITVNNIICLLANIILSLFTLLSTLGEIYSRTNTNEYKIRLIVGHTFQASFPSHIAGLGTTEWFQVILFYHLIFDLRIGTSETSHANG